MKLDWDGGRASVQKLIFSNNNLSTVILDQQNLNTVTIFFFISASIYTVAPCRKALSEDLTYEDRELLTGFHIFCLDVVASINEYTCCAKHNKRIVSSFILCQIQNLALINEYAMFHFLNQRRQHLGQQSNSVNTKYGSVTQW